MILASLLLISTLATLLAFILGTLLREVFSAIRSTAAARGLLCGCAALRQQIPVPVPVRARPTRG